MTLLHMTLGSTALIGLCLGTASAPMVAQTTDTSEGQTVHLVAQASTGKISGTVVDKDGDPVAKAVIRISPFGRNEGTEKGLSVAQDDRASLAAFAAPKKAVTDENGKFTFNSVPAGGYMYQVGDARRVKVLGYASGVVRVKAGETKTVKVKLPQIDAPSRSDDSSKGEK